MECNIAVSDVEINFNPNIYTDILKAWATINHISPNTKEDVLKQVLWFNSNIHSIKNKPMFYKTWSDKGINYLNQIMDEQGNFKSCEELWRNFGREVNLIIWR